MVMQVNYDAGPRYDAARRAIVTECNRILGEAADDWIFRQIMGDAGEGGVELGAPDRGCGVRGMVSLGIEAAPGALVNLRRVQDAISMAVQLLQVVRQGGEVLNNDGVLSLVSDGLAGASDAVTAVIEGVIADVEAVRRS